MAALDVDTNDVTTRYSVTTSSVRLDNPRICRNAHLKPWQVDHPKIFPTCWSAEAGSEVRLGDVATVEVGTMEVSRLAHYNQDQVVFIPVIQNPHQ